MVEGKHNKLLYSNSNIKKMRTIIRLLEVAVLPMKNPQAGAYWKPHQDALVSVPAMRG